MKVKRTLAILVCLMLVFGLFTGCNNNSSKGSITLGSSVPITGANAADGLKMQQAIKLAVDEVNKNGGVLGKNINMLYEDDQGQQSTAVNVANKLISEKVAAVVGPHYSTAVQATTGIYQKAKLPFLTGGTSVALETGNPYFHRVRPSDKIPAAAIGKYAVNTLKAQKVGIMYNNDAFGTGGRDILEEYFKANNVPYVTEGHNTGDKDFTSTISKMKQANIDTLIIWTHDTETGVIAKQVQQLNLNVNKISSGSMALSAVLAMMNQDASEGWYSVADYVEATTDKDQLAFENNFKAKFNSNTELFSATYYSATHILANAINKAGSADSEKINKALSATSGYKGMLGTYTSDSVGNMVHQTNLVQVKSMKPTLIQAVTAS